MAGEPRDIVIIGAGPAGSSAAYAAARAGCRPLLLEQDPTPGARNACGGAIPAALGRRLRLGEGIVLASIRRGTVAVDGRTMRFGSLGPTFVSVARAAFDASLAGRAVAAGAELRTGTRVTHVDPAARRLRWEHLATGREGEVTARVVVFADGPRTLAGGTFGIGHRPGEHTGRALYWVLEGPFADNATAHLRLDGSLATPGYFWVFPKADRTQVGLCLRQPVSGARMKRWLADFVERHADLRGRPVLGRGAGILPGTLARRLVADGALVAGDAAGMVNPITGAGIPFALVSGRIAGTVAAEAARSDRRTLAAYPRRLKRTAHYHWLRATHLCWWWIARGARARWSATYARTVRRYASLCHALGRRWDVFLT